jgi:hypothetical protein
MTAVLRSIVVALAIVAALAPQPGAAQGSSAAQVWTVAISAPFEGMSFTWRLKPDGTYEEDGVYLDSGDASQVTKTGTWSRSRGRMVLKQDDFGFVFDGAASAETYSGTLFQYGQPVSRFCAWKGTEIPAGCDDDAAV